MPLLMRAEKLFQPNRFRARREEFNGSDEMETLLVVEAESVQDFIVEVLKAAFGQRRQMTLASLNESASTQKLISQG